MDSIEIPFVEYSARVQKHLENVNGIRVVTRDIPEWHNRARYDASRGGKVVLLEQAADMEDSVATGKTKQKQVPQCVKHCANASQEARLDCVFAVTRPPC